MFNSEHLQEKWAPILEHSELDNISDKYRKAVTSILLENQESFLKEEAGILNEAAPTMSAGTAGFSGSSTATGPVAGFDPVLISLIRRSMPKLIAYDIAGVQPMTGPTGLIFAMRSRYGTNRTAGTEAFFNEADTEFSAENAASDLGRTAQAGSNPGLLNDSGTYNTSDGMPTAEAEALGDASGNQFAEMNFSIEKVTVTAKSRALKAEYSLELAQDLKAVHGLDAESELANMNAIGHETRRGKGNILICSADVASALSMAGVLDYTPALAGNSNLLPDDNSSTLAGTLNGRIKVYVDPYSANVSDRHFYVAGYKGSSAYDAGLFYCPYVPLQMVRAVGQDTFQPKIGFKTRYGMVANPFAEGTTQGGGDLDPNKNRYYRRVLVDNLM